MKPSVVVLFFIFFVCVKGEKNTRTVLPDGRLKLNLNTIVDGILATVKENASQMGLDPFHLPDVNETFNWSIFNGGLTLTNGQIHNITSIFRQKDVVISLNGNIGDVVAEMGFKELQMAYDFTAKLLGIGPSGVAVGKVTDLLATVEAVADLTNVKQVFVQLKSLTLSSTSLSVHLDGPVGIINTILDAISDVVVGILKAELNGLVAAEVMNIANKQLQNITFDFSNLL